MLNLKNLIIKLLNYTEFNTQPGESKLKEHELKFSMDEIKNKYFISSPTFESSKQIRVVCLSCLSE